jgi:hypothetical protein
MRVWAARAPEWIWVSRNWSRNVETRLIIAYSLIAVMAALVVLGSIMFSKKRKETHCRNSGQGSNTRF